MVALKEEEWAETKVDFLDCSVDRIVPPFDPEESEVHHLMSALIDFKNGL